ncbi:MAG: cyclic nucleotide-binding domain-containing protein, partial [Oscillospiraceae bacterium]|nr:cyclic nucleotide-binding domain-containing protein [Oscillospiraceae bacterium]
MKKFIPILKRTQLFSGVGDEEINAMLNCLQARLCTYKKGEYVFRQGEHIDNITVLVDGKLHIQHDDYWGNRSIITVVSVGEMFGEAYVAPESGS